MNTQSGDLVVKNKREEAPRSGADNRSPKTNNREDRTEPRDGPSLESLCVQAQLYVGEVARNLLNGLPACRIDFEAIAQDAVQELVQSKGARNTLSYLRGIIRNLIRKALAEATTRGGIPPTAVSFSDVHEQAVQPKDDRHRPQITVDRHRDRVIRHSINQVLEEMDPIDAKIFVGRFFEAKTHAEVARNVGLSADAVRKRYSRKLPIFRDNIRALFQLYGLSETVRIPSEEEIKSEET